MSGEMAAYHIRTYREGDEKGLVELFNRVYSGYAGFVPRTPELWLWCCKSRPGIREEGIFIVHSEAEVIAYGVASVSGEILELCHDPDNAGEEVVLKLLETIEVRLKNLEVSSITLNAPKDDQIVRDACTRMGYAESALPYAFQLSILDIARLIEKILISKLGNAKADFDGEVLLKVRQSSSTGYDHVTLEVSNGDLHVEKREAANPKFIIELDKQVLTECIFGNVNPAIGILTKKIRVSPLRKAQSALNFLSQLKLEDPWYIPLSDHG